MLKAKPCGCGVVAFDVDVDFEIELKLTEVVGVDIIRPRFHKQNKLKLEGIMSENEAWGRKAFLGGIAAVIGILVINMICNTANEKVVEVRKEETATQSAAPSQNTAPSQSTASSFVDSRDGKRYKTIRIGSQTWMAENLNNEMSGGKCYDNYSPNCAKYGRMYNWNQAMVACPSGWHLPRDAEWSQLMGYVGGREFAGKKLKSRSGWNDSGNGTDEYGFSALPGGTGSDDGTFSDYSNAVGYWWSATEYENDASEAWYRAIDWFNDYVEREKFWKVTLFYVRCVQ